MAIRSVLTGPLEYHPVMTSSDANPDRRIALRVIALPRDTNQYGTIFGGVILSLIDQAGFIEARKHGSHRWVTASMDRVDFKAAVLVGDVVNLYTWTQRTGTTSVTVCVEVEAERDTTGDRRTVTSATLTMVAVDAQGKPIPFASPPTIGPQWTMGNRA